MAEGTLYVVLRQDSGDTTSYKHAGSYSAPNAKVAVREAVAESNQSGVYIAVPARSFQLVTVDIESTTRVKLS